jgi:putative hydrolase of the HAD superfamily
MIKNIIFDFGDIFINLDKEVIVREMERYGGQPILGPGLHALNAQYEIGAISSEDFLMELVSVYPKATKVEIAQIWNSMLLDLPDHRLEFIEALSREGRYRLFLLSNTNALHIPHVQHLMGTHKFDRFKNSFEKFYLSHEIHLRKPSMEIFRFVLDENDLLAEETFFVDDTKENTEAAQKLGIRCWHLQVGREDIVELKSRL